MDLVCLGLGYSARALVERLRHRGWRVAGTATSPAGLERARSLGVEGIAFDGTAPSLDLARRLASATHLLVSIAPDGDGDPVLRHHRDDICRAGRLAWIGYLSTVGVYGDRGGAWVDETAEPRPGSPRSRHRVAAERDWLDLVMAGGPDITVLRLSGIYGPGRSAIDALAAGTARRIIKPGQVFNRIHVDDIAGAVLAAIDRRPGGGGADPRPARAVYNVTDDEPAPPQDVVAFAARLTGHPVPPDVPYADAELTAMGRSFYAETKRVANAAIKSGLGWRLRYPTYREGIAAIARRAGHAVGGT